MSSSSPSSSSSTSLTREQIKSGLYALGKNPLTLSHTYLGLKVSGKKDKLKDINLLTSYPQLMYLDISDNCIDSLAILSNLPGLVQLNASKNLLNKCLDFAPPRCTLENSWPTGNLSAGSMITLADLSFNDISKVDDLNQHPFLECLILSNNQITTISGFGNLKFLQVLDLSYNSISCIEGLDGLHIQELNLQGNQLKSLDELSNLSRLSVLNVADNLISSLAPLEKCHHLHNLDIRNNKIVNIRQTEFLIGIKWISYLSLSGNPCSNKPHYRSRVLFRLPSLVQLDLTQISSEEKIRSMNLYGSDCGDLRAREEIFAKYFPNEAFDVYNRDFIDDEQFLKFDDLSIEIYDPRSEYTQADYILFRNLASDVVTDIIDNIMINSGSNE